jgi:hypothetical protein
MIVSTLRRICIRYWERNGQFLIFANKDSVKHNMTNTNHSQSGLNPVQEALLRLFSRPISEEETLQLKRVMVMHFGNLLRDEVETAATKKGYTNTDFEKMLNADS